MRRISKILAIFFFAINSHQGYAGTFEKSMASDDASNRWSFFSDILFWNLEETNTQWAFVIDPRFVSPPPPAFSGSFNAVLKGLTFDYSTGIRTGFSYILPHDHWDTRQYFTWYHTDGSSHINPTPGHVIQSQFIASDLLLTFPLVSADFQEAKIKWNVLFNMFNWDVGRTCSLSEFLSLRPHLGVQGGWIHQKINAHWIHSDTIIPYDVRELFKHRFWGVGPEVGMNSNWHLGAFGNHAFSIWGDLSQVFMWGHWSFNEVAYTTINVRTINTQPDREMGALTFQGAAGFIWDYHLRNRPILFTVKLGYELQVWLQQLQFFQHFSGILDNTLTLQGATCRFQLHF